MVATEVVEELMVVEVVIVVAVTLEVVVVVEVSEVEVLMTVELVPLTSARDDKPTWVLVDGALALTVTVSDCVGAAETTMLLVASCPGILGSARIISVGVRTRMFWSPEVGVVISVDRCEGDEMIATLPMVARCDCIVWLVAILLIVCSDAAKIGDCAFDG